VEVQQGTAGAEARGGVNSGANLDPDEGNSQEPGGPGQCCAGLGNRAGFELWLYNGRGQALLGASSRPAGLGDKEGERKEWWRKSYQQDCVPGLGD
jgi:hypothetical protein